jgi:hypothetical protein
MPPDLRRRLQKCQWPQRAHQPARRQLPFGPATTFPATDTDSASASALMIVPGHAALVINSDAVTTEPVS